MRAHFTLKHCFNLGCIGFSSSFLLVVRRKGFPVPVPYMKHNERARVAPLPFVHRKYMNGRLRRVAACGGLRPPAATVRHAAARHAAARHAAARHAAVRHAACLRWPAAA